MAITPQIFETYRAPQRVLRRLLDQGTREDRALVLLMLACGIIFVAQWPRLARMANGDANVPLEAMLGAALLGWGFIAPLFFYLLAGIAHVLARLVGGRGSWYSARLSLFWTMLATAPLWLIHGLVAGFAPDGLLISVVGGVVLIAFVWIWGATMLEAERKIGVEFDEGVT